MMRILHILYDIRIFVNIIFIEYIILMMLPGDSLE